MMVVHHTSLTSATTADELIIRVSRQQEWFDKGLTIPKTMMLKTTHGIADQLGELGSFSDVSKLLKLSRRRKINPEMAVMQFQLFYAEVKLSLSIPTL